jgi:hypothetical protein
MEKLNIRNKNEIANKLSLEMLKLIRDQEAKINFLTFLAKKKEKLFSKPLKKFFRISFRKNLVKANR